MHRFDRAARILQTAAILCVLFASACAPRVQIATQLESLDPLAPASGFATDFRVSTDSITVALTNVGSESIEVLWQKARIVDTAGNAWNVTHGPGGGKWAELRATADDVSVIAPRTALKETIRPRHRVDAASSADQPFTPVECGPVRCTGYETLVGKTVQLEMTLRRGGEEKQYDWRFRITRVVTSIRGSRPTDPDLTPSFAPARPRLGGSAYGSSGGS